MQDPEHDRWTRRFDTEAYVFGEEPNDFLRRMAARLTPLPGADRALAYADGEGRNGVWLARQGWHVHATDFAVTGLAKSRHLAARHGVTLELKQTDIHAWDWPVARYDLVADIFTQFSTPAQRATKWAGAMAALRPGGYLILQGYTPRQLDFGTGGPRVRENLYDIDMLRAAFADLEILWLETGEVILDEGPGHAGPSAVIGMLARKG